MLEPSAETYASVVGLRTVRRFRPEPLSPDDRDAILEAGRWTGSSKNRQSWTVIVITERAQIERLAECGDFTKPLLGAATVLVPVRLPDGYDWDLGRMSQNMMLAAAARGVGSCPITFHREDCAREVLGVPDDHGCRFALAMGYPDESAELAGRSSFSMGGRKSLESLVRNDRF
ncbi:MAG: nitroreductase family protein [Acidimicrobiia bacterium]|nr:nitroreductase family protein [Acidimicrobiia bacterium]MDH4307407.1 nitroreductase family protein [Acidimicrobiia bacterium]MDH5292497.1 nitroreductase family protein [Acidimicrobiia bacterium]